MIETQNPEIDLLRLREHIAQDLVRARTSSSDVTLSLDDSDLGPKFTASRPSLPPPYEIAALQPAFVPRADGSYDVHELMAFHDAAFVAAAYQAILGREADPAGFAHYLGKLHAGETKAEILGELRNSEEGRAKGAQVRGLGLRHRLARLGKLPVIGKVTQVLTAVWQLPAAQRNQRQFQDYVVSVLGQVQENARAQSDRLRAAIEALGAEQDKIAAHFERVERRMNRQGTRFELLRGALGSARADLSELERALELHRRSFEATRKTLETLVGPGGDDHALDEFYAAFEGRFRGTRDDIKHRQGVYLPLIAEAGAGTAEAPVLDLGCGRGEWLELLGEQHLSARGADLNRAFISDNRARGLDVVEQDVLSCLRAQKTGSLGAITSFHLIEHLPFKVLIALLDEALRVLKPGGVLILETPNPGNLQVGACNFYIDPTHRNPIPSVLAAALLELRGFSRVSLKDLHPWPESEWVTDGGPRVDATLNRLLFGPQDYGVIGWKATG